MLRFKSVNWWSLGLVFWFYIKFDKNKQISIVGVSSNCKQNHICHLISNFCHFNFCLNRKKSYLPWSIKWFLTNLIRWTGSKKKKINSPSKSGFGNWGKSSVTPSFLARVWLSWWLSHVTPCTLVNIYSYSNKLSGS